MSNAADAVPNCRRCQHPVKLIRAIPQIGMLPELQVFRCVACSEIETQENQKGEVGPPQLVLL
jgi:hypothetical protein